MLVLSLACLAFLSWQYPCSRSFVPLLCRRETCSFPWYSPRITEQLWFSSLLKTCCKRENSNQPVLLTRLPRSSVSQQEAFLLCPRPEAHKHWFRAGVVFLFFFLGLSLIMSSFGCNVARAFSRACSFHLILVHIWA